MQLERQVSRINQLSLVASWSSMYDSQKCGQCLSMPHQNKLSLDRLCLMLTKQLQHPRAHSVTVQDFRAWHVIYDGCSSMLKHDRLAIPIRYHIPYCTYSSQWCLNRVIRRESNSNKKPTRASGLDASHLQESNGTRTSAAVEPRPAYSQIGTDETSANPRSYLYTAGRAY